MKPTTDSQVKIVRDVLLSGIRIDRVMMFQQYGIGDLRSRISDVKNDYNIIPERKTKPGKRYLEYWIQNKIA